MQKKLSAILNPSRVRELETIRKAERQPQYKAHCKLHGFAKIEDSQKLDLIQFHLVDQSRSTVFKSRLVEHIDKH